jgi:hypothetical protein
MSLIQIAGSKFVRGWQNWDMLEMMQQLRTEPAAPTYIAARSMSAKIWGLANGLPGANDSHTASL